jgi:tetratricopeptide (TPR) repeat protein
VALAFAQVSDAVAVLADRFGPEKPAEILAAYRRLPRDEVFPKILGMTEEEFEDAWRRSLRERSWPADTGAMAQTIRLSPVDETEFLGADARGHVRFGDRLRSQGQAAAALLQYKKALQQEPDNGVALVKAARAHLDLEQTDKAEEVLRRAVEKNESYVTPYVLLGEILFDDGRYEDAQQILQEALEINPFHPRVHETLGLVALDVGNFPAARRSMELSLSLDPSNEELRQALKRMPKRDK